MSKFQCSNDNGELHLLFRSGHYNCKFINSFVDLKSLELTCSVVITEKDKLPRSLTILSVGCKNVNVSNLCNLKQLTISNCSNISDNHLRQIPDLESLKVNALYPLITGMGLLEFYALKSLHISLTNVDFGPVIYRLVKLEKLFIWTTW